MNYFQKHYGTGIMPILAVLFIIGFSVAFSISFEWWVGIATFAGFAFLFWTQRNTK